PRGGGAGPGAGEPYPSMRDQQAGCGQPLRYLVRRRRVAEAASTEAAANPGSTARSRAKSAPTAGFAATDCSASTAYDTGITLAIHCSTVAISSRGWNSPHSSSWGSTTTGISWMAWNSVLANALASRPRPTPSSASSRVTANSQPIGPATVRPSHSDTTLVTATWISATMPNA